MVIWEAFRLHWEQGSHTTQLPNGIELTTDVQRHLLTAKRDGAVLWRYRADGGSMVRRPPVQNYYVHSVMGTVTY